MTTRHVELRIAADHPSLPGHFPGRPIVPGVLLLDQAIAAAEDWLRRPLRIASLQHAKFTRPLLPRETATLAFALNERELRFEIHRADERIAQGVFRLAAE
jgi:3-hydroxymyristoyl/3-hydroxydecanoyl-(acyl carrier protein) dehydratase